MNDWKPSPAVEWLERDEFWRTERTPHNQYQFQPMFCTKDDTWGTLHPLATEFESYRSPNMGFAGPPVTEDQIREWLEHGTTPAFHTADWYASWTVHQGPCALPTGCQMCDTFDQSHGVRYRRPQRTMIEGQWYEEGHPLLAYRISDEDMVIEWTMLEELEENGAELQAVESLGDGE